MSGDHEDVRILLGGYVLGGLHIVDRRAIQAYLLCCPACRTELTEIAPLRLLLDLLSFEEARSIRGGRQAGPRRPQV